MGLVCVVRSGMAYADDFPEGLEVGIWYFT